MCARADLRRRWRSFFAVAALIAVAGSVVLTAYAGAERTDSAYPRYLRATHSADFLIATEASGTTQTNEFYRSVEALPQVERGGILFGPSLISVSASGAADLSNEDFVQTMASEDGKAGYTIGASRMLAGRMPRPDRPFEALVNRALATERHLNVGSRLAMYPVPTDANAAAYTDIARRERPLTFTITGIGVSADEIVPIAPNDGLPTLFLTPAYYRAHHSPAETNFDGVEVRLRPGTDVQAFRAAVTRASRAYKHLGGLFVGDLALHQARTERAIHPEALALQLFDLFVAIGAALAIGQVLWREVQLAAADHPTLRAMGFDQRQLMGAAIFRLVPPIVVGGALAVAGALAGSLLMPIGAARLAEPDPGLSLGYAVLGAGFGAIVVIFAAIATVAAWAVTRPRSGSSAGAERPMVRAWRGAAPLSRAGLRPSAVNGLRMAFESGRGRAAVPVRSALVGTVMAVAAVVGALTFGANLGRLASTPSLFGVTWDVGLDAQFQAISRAQAMAVDHQLPGVLGISGGSYGDDVSLDGHIVPAIGIDRLKGSVSPTIVQGHQPTRPGQVALGAETMRELHTEIGASVTLVSGSRSRHLRVVGEVVLPSFGRGSFTPTDLGEGAVTTASVVGQPPAGRGHYNFVLLRFARADRVAGTRAVTQIAHHLGCPADECLMNTQRLLPTDVKSYDRVKATPLYLAGILALLGAAMVAHALVTSVRRRRRDLALLKTLGFTTRQLATTVAWQASAFALVGLAFGFPAGVALGHWLWSVFANQIGIPTSSVFPLAALLVVPGTLLLANVVAALPGRAAARTRAALVLHTD
jgi:hypothetical protein